MKEIYKGFPSIEFTIKNEPYRVGVEDFKEAAIEFMLNGRTPEEIKGVIQEFERDEMYEAAQGLKEALEEVVYNKSLLK